MADAVYRRCRTIARAAGQCCWCCSSDRACDAEESIPLTTATTPGRDRKGRSSSISEEEPPTPMRRQSSFLWDSARKRLQGLGIGGPPDQALASEVQELHPRSDPIPACLLSYDSRLELLPLLPPSLQPQGCSHWELLFSSEEHGCSFITFFARTHDRGPTLVLVRDAMGHTFGAFAGESWRREPDSHYHGNGDSFLFSTWPDGFRHWPWTGANRHFQLATHDCLAFGGGGHFGLWLGNALGTGSTGRCETYANDPLTEQHRVRGGLPEPQAADASAFEVREVQVWGFAGSQRTAARSRAGSTITPQPWYRSSSCWSQSRWSQSR